MSELVVLLDASDSVFVKFHWKVAALHILLVNKRSVLFALLFRISCLNLDEIFPYSFDCLLMVWFFPQ